MNRLQNATCGVQEKRVVCNYITIYRTHILFIEHIHHNVHTNVHPIHNHSQCTLHTHKHSHTILYYTRSPATSRPLNGHSAITIPIIRRWRSPSHTTCFLHCSVIHIMSLVCFPGLFLVLPLRCITWLQVALAQCLLDGPVQSARGHLVRCKLLSLVLSASCCEGCCLILKAPSRFLRCSCKLHATLSAAAGSRGTPWSIVSRRRQLGIGLDATSSYYPILPS